MSILFPRCRRLTWDEWVVLILIGLSVVAVPLYRELTDGPPRPLEIEERPVPAPLLKPEVGRLLLPVEFC